MEERHLRFLLTKDKQPSKIVTKMTQMQTKDKANCLSFNNP